MTLPTAPVAISCGEPAGIGPEVTVGAWRALRHEIPLFWIGDPRHLPQNTPYEIITDPSGAHRVCPTALPVLSLPFAHPSQPGSPTGANAAGVIASIAKAVELTQSGAASAVCTAPIHKKALKDGADFAYPGHTEYLAALAGQTDVVMMLASDELRVVPATIHIALEDVPTSLTPQLLRKTIEITARALKTQFGCKNPRIAIAGLNPHAGEGGAMGQQELLWINQLVQDMVSEGLSLSGPHPADTLFHKAARARYDVAIAMYHDQALIPIKTLDFDKGVNVTLGLPFIRTSPDHGTAFDIAGTGNANPTSMTEAIKLAWQMAQNT